MVRWGIGSPEASHSAQVWVTRDMQRCRVSGQNELHFKVIELKLGKISDECWKNAGQVTKRQISWPSAVRRTGCCRICCMRRVRAFTGRTWWRRKSWWATTFASKQQSTWLHENDRHSPESIPHTTKLDFMFVLYVHEFPEISAVLPPFGFIFKLHRGFLKFHGQCFAFHCHIAQVWHCRRQQL